MPGATTDAVVLCPGQGAQAVGMGRAWYDRSDAAREVLDRATDILRDGLDAPLRDTMFEGPAEVLNRTDVSQPAIYSCSVASFAGLGELVPSMTAGLSLGEYTALHLAGVFDFETGLRLVADRGRLMQGAAGASDGSMVALIGATNEQAEEVCTRAAEGGVLVPANFNAPGQIVISGDRDACARAEAVAADLSLRAAPLTVAGAFHSPHMQPAADRMAEILAETDLRTPSCPVWSNVTAQPHVPDDAELLRQRLVEQIVNPVRWSQLCQEMSSVPANAHPDDESNDKLEWHELAPGSVLRGLMRRIDRSKKVMNHDES